MSSTHSKLMVDIKATIPPVHLDIDAARRYQDHADCEWQAQNPVQSIGYEERLLSITARDTTRISVKVTCPGLQRIGNHDRPRLPVLFITHGGGYISGSHTSEEAWTVRRLQKALDLVTVSVEYRLAPENTFPTWVEDAEDVLEQLLENSDLFISTMAAQCDLSRLILLGSSAGAGISAVLSQTFRDRGVAIRGVVLNVPMLCHYRSSPGGLPRSYLEGHEGTAQIVACWDILLPENSEDIRASPLLGDVRYLPPHLTFVAGNDPLRDEGIAYVHKLQCAKINATLRFYTGVSHGFALEGGQVTESFEADLIAGVRELLSS